MHLYSSDGGKLAGTLVPLFSGNLQLNISPMEMKQSEFYYEFKTEVVKLGQC